MPALPPPACRASAVPSRQIPTAVRVLTAARYPNSDAPARVGLLGIPEAREESAAAISQRCEQDRWHSQTAIRAIGQAGHTRGFAGLDERRAAVPCLSDAARCSGTGAGIAPCAIGRSGGRSEI